MYIGRKGNPAYLEDLPVCPDLRFCENPASIPVLSRKINFGRVKSLTCGFYQVFAIYLLLLREKRIVNKVSSVCRDFCI